MRTYCTYFDHHYLDRGLAMLASLRRTQGDFHLHVLALSATCERVLRALAPSGVTVHTLGELEVADPDLAAVKAARSRIEYYFTATPCLLRHLLRDLPPGEVLTYLDSDLFFFADCEPLYREFGDASVGIVGHRFAPGLERLERYGSYNVGWLSFRNDDPGRACLDWYRERCLEWCHDRVEGDRFADQKYLDAFPGFSRVAELRHPGANVAPWNVGGVRLSRDGDRVLVDGRDLLFFHFHRLRRMTGRVFDTGLRGYGARLGPVLRDAIFVPYLEALARAEDMLTGAGLETVAKQGGMPSRRSGRLRLLARNLMTLVHGSWIRQEPPLGG